MQIETNVFLNQEFKHIHSNSKIRLIGPYRLRVSFVKDSQLVRICHKKKVDEILTDDDEEGSYNTTKGTHLYDVLKLISLSRKLKRLHKMEMEALMRSSQQSKRGISDNEELDQDTMEYRKLIGSSYSMSKNRNRWSDKTYEKKEIGKPLVSILKPTTISTPDHKKTVQDWSTIHCIPCNIRTPPQPPKIKSNKNGWSCLPTRAFANVMNFLESPQGQLCWSEICSGVDLPRIKTEVMRPPPKYIPSKKFASTTSTDSRQALVRKKAEDDLANNQHDKVKTVRFFKQYVKKILHHSDMSKEQKDLLWKRCGPEEGMWGYAFEIDHEDRDKQLLLYAKFYDISEAAASQARENLLGGRINLGFPDSSMQRAVSWAAIHWETYQDYNNEKSGITWKKIGVWDRHKSEWKQKWAPQDNAIYPEVIQALDFKLVNGTDIRYYCTAHIPSLVFDITHKIKEARPKDFVPVSKFPDGYVEVVVDYARFTKNLNKTEEKLKEWKEKNLKKCGNCSKSTDTNNNNNPTNNNNTNAVGEAVAGTTSSSASSATTSAITSTKDKTEEKLKERKEKYLKKGVQLKNPNVLCGNCSKSTDTNNNPTNNNNTNALGEAVAGTISSSTLSATTSAITSTKDSTNNSKPVREKKKKAHRTLPVLPMNRSGRRSTNKNTTTGVDDKTDEKPCFNTARKIFTSKGGWVLPSPITPGKFHCVALAIFGEIEKIDRYDIFAKPVSDSDAPNYSGIVSNRIDLATMMTKLNNGDYRECGASNLYADFLLMFDNCRLYNGVDAVVTLEAARMMAALPGIYEDVTKRESRKNPEPPSSLGSEKLIAEKQKTEMLLSDQSDLGTLFIPATAKKDKHKYWEHVRLVADDKYDNPTTLKHGISFFCTICKGEKRTFTPGSTIQVKRHVESDEHINSLLYGDGIPRVPK
jgi:hypothetical protein